MKFSDRLKHVLFGTPIMTREMKRDEDDLRAAQEGQTDVAAWDRFSDDMLRAHMRDGEFDREGFSKRVGKFAGLLTEDQKQVFTANMVRSRVPEVFEATMEQMGEVRESNAFMSSLLRQSASTEMFDAVYDAKPESHPQSKAFTALSLGRNIESYLAANEVDILERDGAGNTPAHIAAMQGHPEDFRGILKLAKEAGEVDPRNNAGETPMHKVFHFREDRAENPFRPATRMYLYEAVAKRIEVASEMGADVNAVSHSGRRPIHELADVLPGVDDKPRALEAWDRNIKTLARSGADMSAADGQGRVPTDLTERDNPFQKNRANMLIVHGSRPKDPSRVDYVEDALKEGNGKALLALEQMGSSWRDDLGGEQAVFYGILKAKDLDSVKPVEAMKEANVPFGVKNDRGMGIMTFAFDMDAGDKTLAFLKDEDRAMKTAEIQSKVAARRAASASSAKKTRAKHAEAR